METVTEMMINAFPNSRNLSDRDLVLNIMRNVEAEVNGGIISCKCVRKPTQMNLASKG